MDLRDWIEMELKNAEFDKDEAIRDNDTQRLAVADLKARMLGEIQRRLDFNALDDYQRKAARTIACPNDPMICIMHALFGLPTEVGELTGMYQKQYQGHELNKAHAMKEAGDILWMLAEYCTAMGWKLSDVAALNIEKLYLRYPDGFRAEDSLHRRPDDL